MFIPKYRRKFFYFNIKQHLGSGFHNLACQKDCKIEIGHLTPDHVHMLISISPKYLVSNVIGFMKGKRAIYIARNLLNRQKTLRVKAFGLEAIL